MAEHTSGPWRVGAETAIFGGSDGRIIGQCYGSPGLPPGPAEAAANARLIAAAPELLAALNGLLTWIGAVNQILPEDIDLNESDFETDLPSTVRGARERAQAAARKARP